MMLSGRVTLGGLSAASHVVVEVHNSEGDILDQMQVDRSGVYAFHLVAGSWCLRAWDSQGRRGLVEIDVGDKDTVLDIELKEPEGVPDE